MNYSPSNYKIDGIQNLPIYWACSKLILRYTISSQKKSSPKLHAEMTCVSAYDRECQGWTFRSETAHLIFDGTVYRSVGWCVLTVGHAMEILRLKAAWLVWSKTVLKTVSSQGAISTAWCTRLLLYSTAIPGWLLSTLGPLCDCQWAAEYETSIPEPG